jgi:hypothetical protein
MGDVDSADHQANHRKMAISAQRRPANSLLMSWSSHIGCLVFRQLQHFQILHVSRSDSLPSIPERFIQHKT